MSAEIAVEMHESATALILAYPGAKCLNDVKDLIGLDQLRQDWYDLALRDSAPGEEVLDATIMDAIDGAVATMEAP
jgi:hypothetical protein